VSGSLSDCDVAASASDGFPRLRRECNRAAGVSGGNGRAADATQPRPPDASPTVGVEVTVTGTRSRVSYTAPTPSP